MKNQYTISLLKGYQLAQIANGAFENKTSMDLLEAVQNINGVIIVNGQGSQTLVVEFIDNGAKSNARKIPFACVDDHIPA